MFNEKLKLIDFSQGIRSTEIQHNFNVLQSQLNKERISVAGAGISYGLNFTLNEFDLIISQGCLIDNEGKEVYIDTTTINIEKPVLIPKEETQKIVDANHRIYVSEYPYANNRIVSSDQVDVKDSGIQVNISNMSGSSSIINLAAVDERVITLNGSNLSGIKVDVKYNYTARRRDIVFIDKDYKIQYRKGITSTSPSIPKLKPDEFTYILGYVEVNGVAKNKENKLKAKVEVIKEFRSTRNVYTDSNNKLYLCGTPFESIKIIHTVEPTNPTLDTFWYDMSSNKLKVWRRTDIFEFADAITFTSIDPNHPQKFATNVKYKFGNSELEVYVNNKKLIKGTDKEPKDWQEGSDLTDVQKQEGAMSQEFRISKKLNKGDIISYVINKYDGFEEWVNVNDTSYVPVNERHLWTPELLENEVMDYEHDMQHFFFDAEALRNMLYVPGKNSLEILIDQVPLHNDQFDEITMYDAITGQNSIDIKNKLLKYYNFKDNFDPDLINEQYENVGLGFKLHAPLQKKCYIEVRVTHRVNASPLSKRFQRTATFVNEGDIVYGTNSIIPTSTPYRVQENQLEVFLNGRKLVSGKEFKETITENQLKGSNSESFEILPAAKAKNGDVVYYRITTSVYSYDHLDGLLSKFDRRITDAEVVVKDTLELVTSKIEYIDDKIEQIDDQLDSLQNLESSLDTRFIKRTDKIGKENLKPEIVTGIAERSFYQTYSVSNVPQSIDITSVCSANDFVVLYNITGNRILQRGSDFDIVESNGSVALRVTSMSAENSTLYLTGIKFNRA